MSRINRRALLLNAGSAVIASTVAASAFATEPRRRDREPSRDLRAIKAHKATYAAFGKAIHEVDGSHRDHHRASRAEERALLAVCAYPAVREGDRRAKARYLLRIEARGELDLAEHMQALLRSTMWKG
ncbi:hypothetical protein [Mesorhizobium wenxiniae]|uniref:Uncharacterized protein n=1 Tax=Mesorhizobium wenxiniae TaxID=2014805 RepID=A0A271K8J5_9HYPH|nr:hypothetical protein [Mesorhizobium wenxiniae]PAP92093.1 hypothetical protein CIT31_29370 [Mesorhizobium wenxiniae]